MNSSKIPVSPMIIRGEVIVENLVTFGGRGGNLEFYSPDPIFYIDQLGLGHPEKLRDLYQLSFDDILDYLMALGERLTLESNPYLREALELSYLTAPVTKPILDFQYAGLQPMFSKDFITEMAEHSIGIRYLEGWVPSELQNGRKYNVRAFGAKTVHVVAGNSPTVSALSIIRNAITRSDAIIKSPSNDPFTALAIARTMCEMAPDHPLTRHLSVAYWKGGDSDFEEKLYQPHNIEKIIAWGGFSGIKHITRYIQPGLELISLDPKRSVSIVGKSTFATEAEMRQAAIRLATDVGIINQQGCVCSRLAYIHTGSGESGLEKANAFGQMVYEALLALPETISTAAKIYDRNLKTHVDAIRLQDEWFRVIGGDGDEGAVIVSQMPEPVDFAPLLTDRTLNIVPIDDLEDVFEHVDAYTQTVGIYPEALKAEFLDILPLYGAQRIVSLGYAGQGVNFTAPQDAIEPVRRMCKWLVNEIADPETVPPVWAGAQIIGGT